MACSRACVHACVYVCVCACVRVCIVCVGERACVRTYVRCGYPNSVKLALFSISSL